MLQIQENVSLKKFNTFGIDANARYFAEISHEDELAELFADPQWLNINRLVLGGGSNMLLVKDFEGLAIRINIRGIEHRISHDDVFVDVGAGEVWNDLVNFCVDRNYAGMENLSLIPGSVGASPIQNIGAYGVELKDVFASCRAFEIATGTFRTFSKEDCKFGYRESVFKTELAGQYIIVSVKFHLSLRPAINLKYGAIEQELINRGITRPSIEDVSKVVSSIRVSKLPDPSTIGNAGSFFKNPVIGEVQFRLLQGQFPDVVNYPAGEGQYKLAAGWLIEQCGWKGKTVGNTGTWKNQALVLVNHGGATGEEVYSLSSQIIDSVYTKFGVMLQREVNIIS
ncbi:UDP-N-acetylmuramate dehydrogenase [Mucilaginibacter phyllosphaerae]|uniref:UDP-N-acetylenolpyruvoylglucosamine reductase n=1 Tax=Mucilaginibacter phyllosphaerae TaxID=1812349 RepID=A0A4Y8AG76_9SPHI|nr:UDP-N-acetylmuramate dehydrogenase [Mucilaginibacter phyllosphaerae]MBB3968596.1 UDP-N-acetylmuramate dehydrogenase [Mucilaginibacter phyllosphaerae]TEW67764.1 UDP-N-acetylmuramate dehydrogenase [Mucilaginibacter phyllosphaerae]GGH15025.1 UDP-N-acetylenolpyruvoylglucosamine reductase [Mucilaginibacter phyllosphaerae]